MCSALNLKITIEIIHWLDTATCRWCLQKCTSMLRIGEWRRGTTANHNTSVKCYYLISRNGCTWWEMVDCYWSWSWSWATQSRRARLCEDALFSACLDTGGWIFCSQGVILVNVEQHCRTGDHCWQAGIVWCRVRLSIVVEGVLGLFLPVDCWRNWRTERVSTGTSRQIRLHLGIPPFLPGTLGRIMTSRAFSHRNI